MAKKRRSRAPNTDTIYRIKPGPVDPAHAAAGFECRLVSFPPTRGPRRFLHPDGEEVIAKTSAEKRWWIRMLRSGDVVLLKTKGKIKSDAWDGPHPEGKPARDPENPKENAPAVG